MKPDEEDAALSEPEGAADPEEDGDPAGGEDPPAAIAGSLDDELPSPSRDAAGRLSVLRGFQHACREHVAEILEFMLPEVMAAADCSRVELMSEDLWSDYPAPKARFPYDLVGRLRLRKNGRPVMIHVVFTDDVTPDLGKVVRRHMTQLFLYQPSHAEALSVVVALRGGPARPQIEEVRESIGTLELSCFRFPLVGIAAARAEEWQRGPGPLVTALTAWMGSDRMPPRLRRQLAREALDRAPIDDGRRRLLHALVDAAAEWDAEAVRQAASLPEKPPLAVPYLPKEIAAIMKEVPTLPPVDVPMLADLLRAYFADVVDLFGGYAAEDLDFSSFRFLADEEWKLHPDPPTQTPALIEMVAELGHKAKKRKKRRALLYFQVARDRRGSDRRTLRRYMQLRLVAPDAAVIPLTLFFGRRDQNQTEICEVFDLNGKEMTSRFFYRSTSIAASTAETFAQDSRPVAWALSVLMRRWEWKPRKLKIHVVESIGRADLDFPDRLRLTSFVEKHLPLEPEDEQAYRDAMREEAEAMRVAMVRYLDERLLGLMPKELRQRMLEVEHSLELYRLMEEAYEFALEKGLVVPPGQGTDEPAN